LGKLQIIQNRDLLHLVYTYGISLFSEFFFFLILTVVDVVVVLTIQQP
jgi:hypothetical protein